MKLGSSSTVQSIATRIAALACAVAVVAVGLGVAAAPAGASSSFTSNTWFSIVNRNSADCVDARGGGTANGTAIQQYQCNNTFAQQYLFVAQPNGAYAIINRKNGNQVLDVTGVSYGDGAKVELWQWNGGANQQWYPQSLGGGYYRFVARHSGKCLDVPGASSSSGLQLQQYSCNGTPAQSFLLTPPGSQQGRGDQRSAQVFWWGVRVWIDHGMAQNLVNQYRVEGTVGAATKLLSKIPALASPLVSLEASHIACLTGVFNTIASDDQGYGVVVDVPWYTPFWGCGINMWAQ